MIVTIVLSRVGGVIEGLVIIVVIIGVVVTVTIVLRSINSISINRSINS